MSKKTKKAVPAEPAPCALCGQMARLKVSHVAPAFAFRWLKTTSATGYFRMGMQPERRVQDGFKFPWLCGDCEARLGGFERTFANKAFHPRNDDDAATIVYDEWMMKFCVSISWRTLKYYERTQGFPSYSEAQIAACQAASERWADVLLDRAPHPGAYEQHLMIFGPVESASQPVPKGLNRYLLRSVAIDIVAGERTVFTYSKLGKFGIFGFIVPSRQKWVGTKINANGGTIGTVNYEVPGYLGAYLAEKAAQYEAAAERIPKSQRDAIEADIWRNPERALSSLTLEAMLRDAELSGSDAILRKR